MEQSQILKKDLKHSPMSILRTINYKHIPPRRPQNNRNSKCIKIISSKSYNSKLWAKQQGSIRNKAARAIMEEYNYLTKRWCPKL